MQYTHEILEKFSVFLMDCDGVIWKGSEPVPGVAETINHLKSLGKRFYYVTNNSSKTRDAFAKKLRSFGINATSEEVISSASTTAYYLKSINYDKKVYVVGESGLIEELKNQGIESYGLEDNGREFNYDNLVDLHEDVGAVICGIDVNMNYLKLSKACQYLRDKTIPNEKGESSYKCTFISTNTDETFPYNNGRVVVGSGSILSVLELTSGRKPDIIIGKPFKYMMECIQQDAHCNLEDMIMVGDRLEKDIAFGNLQNIHTICVLTGITNQQMLDSLDKEKDSSLVPTYVLSSFKDLYE